MFKKVAVWEVPLSMKSFVIDEDKDSRGSPRDLEITASFMSKFRGSRRDTADLECIHL